MFNIIDFIKRLFKLVEVRAETDTAAPAGGAQPEEMTAPAQLWPRLMFFRPSSSSKTIKCDEEEELQTIDDCDVHAKKLSEEIVVDCEEVEETPSEEEKCVCPQTGGFSKKLGCMYRGARSGLKEGALTGVFFGGGLGIYKYFDNLLKGEGKEGGSEEGGGSGEDNESTTNDNIIFVTAANGAIAMAVFCTVFCSTKAVIYCN